MKTYLFALALLMGPIIFPQFVFSQSPPPPPSGGGAGCDNSPLLCNINDLDGYNGATTASGSSTVCPFGSPGSSCPLATCENNIWFSFTANFPTIEIEINPTSCSGGGPNGLGMQGVIYQVTDCTNLNGFTEVAPCFTSGAVEPFTLSATNLTIGEIYLIMLDGFAGSVCEFDVDVLSVSSPTPTPIIPPSIVGPGTVCIGAVVEYCVPVGTGITEYNWSWASGGIGTITNLGLSADGTEICAIVEITGEGFGLLEILGTNACYSGNVGTNAQLLPVNSIPIVNPPEADQFCLGGVYTWECYSFISTPGFYECNYESWLGCDSTVSIVLTPFPVTLPNIDFVEVCNDELPIVWNGQQLDESGTYFYFYSDTYGCEVGDQIHLYVFETESIIQSASFACEAGDTITLDGTASTSIAPSGSTLSYLWTGPGIVGVDTGMTVEIDQAGEYFFEVNYVDSLQTVNCISMSSVIVGVDISPPDAPILNGPSGFCSTDELTTYQLSEASTGLPANGFIWEIDGGTITAISNDLVNVKWDGPGQICGAAFHDCDTSAFTCLDVGLIAAPSIDELYGPLEVCPTDSTVEYSIAVNDWLESWTLTGGASYTTDPENNRIIVDFTGANNVTICVEAENSCGVSDTLCESIVFSNTVLAPLLDSPIEGVPFACLGSTVEYCIDLGENISEYIWSWQSGDLGTITATGINEDSTQICLDILVEEEGEGVLEVSGLDVCGVLDIENAMQSISIESGGNDEISSAVSICSGEVLSWSCYTDLDSTGYYECVSQDLNGCDSIVGLDLTVLPENSLLLEEVELCDEGSTYEWNGQVYAESGVYFYESLDSNGCIIPEQLNLSIIQVPLLANPIEGESSVCIGSTVEYCIDLGENIGSYNWSWDTGNLGNIISTGLNDDSTQMCMEVEITELGIASLMIEGTDLCETDDLENATQFLIVESQGPYTITQDTMICDGDVLQWACNDSISEAGIYECLYTSVFGCDSILNLNIGLIFDPVASFDYAQTAGATNFENNSEGATSYIWDFGDGNGSTEFSPIHSYATTGVYEVTLIATNECSSDTTQLTVDFTSSILGVTEEMFFNIFPNPVLDQVSVQFQSNGLREDKVSLRLYDMLGHVIKEIEIDLRDGGFEFYLDLEGMPAGLYFVEIDAGVERLIQRIIKQ